MNSDVMKGKWTQLKGEVKAKWGDLTDDEWTEVGGNKDKLAGKLQEKYGHAKDTVSRGIDDFLNRNRQDADTAQTDDDMNMPGQRSGNQSTDVPRNPNRTTNDRDRKVS